MATFPETTGREVAGVVDEVGDGVTDVALGDPVFGFVAGGARRSGPRRARRLRAGPAVARLLEAAGLAVAVETAVRTLDLLGVGAGTTVLINGAAGGVGTAATQIARSRDARVIGTASPNHHDYLRSLGAEPTSTAKGSSSACGRSFPTASTSRSTPRAARCRRSSS